LQKYVEYINEKYEDKAENKEMPKVITQAKLKVEDDLKTLSQTPQDPKMSDSVSVKAGKHMLSGVGIVQIASLNALHLLRLLRYRPYQLHDLALILSSDCQG
jgi:hypothetical protein